MPSLQQLRHEALAAAIEPFLKPRLLVKVLGVRPDPLLVRVERVDGSIMEFRLVEVVLDGAELLGQDAEKHSVIIPLADVKTVWRRRLRLDRTLAGWVAMTAAAVLGTLALYSSAPLGGIVAGSVVLGLPFTVALIVFGERRRLFSEWAVVYDRGD